MGYLIGLLVIALVVLIAAFALSERQLHRGQPPKPPRPDQGVDGWRDITTRP